MAGNLYKRGKTWWGRFTVDGTEHRQSLRTVHVGEARQRLAKLKEDAESNRFWGGSQMPWEAAMLRYQDEIMGAAVKSSTAKRYRVSLRQVSRHLEGKPVHAIRPKDIAAMVAARRKEGATNATIRRDLTAVSRVFAACKTWGACDHNPAMDYDRAMIRERRDPIVLPTDKDIWEAIGKVPTRVFGDLIAFAEVTGMRQAEILGLDWRDVDLARKAITLNKTKTDSPRVVPAEGRILGRALDIIRRLDHRRGLLFAQTNSEPYRNFPSQFAAWRRRNGVKFRFHDLRHKFAVDYLRTGGNVYALQRILGHSSIKTTEIYLAYLTPEERLLSMHGAQNSAQA